MKNRNITFFEKEHRYIDEFFTKFISVTQFYPKFLKEFDKYEMAKRCESAGRRNPNSKYAGKTAKMLMAEWENEADTANAFGSRDHGYAEDSIKKATGIKTGSPIYQFGGVKLFTIIDAINDPVKRRIDFDILIQCGFVQRHKTLTTLLAVLHNSGFEFYSELVVYHPEFPLIGSIDLLAMRRESNGRYTARMIDYKTNKDPITFVPGYWEHDKEYNRTGKFVETDKYFLHPISHVPASIGHKYSMQLSIYSYLLGFFNVDIANNLILHITYPDRKRNPEDLQEAVIPALDLRNEVATMCDYEFVKKRNLLVK